MTYSYGVTLLILCPLVFLAAFIDSIAGGGGLISLPAYILAGFPIHTAGGTNKFSSSIGTLAAVINYIRSGSVDFAAAVAGGLAAIAGAWTGTRLALSLSPRVLQICLMVILPLAGIFILTSRGMKTPVPKKPLSFRLKILCAAAVGLVIGCYDGFFGPGAGMFMTLALAFLVRLELIKAVGTTKVLNFSSNMASMVTWLVNGKVFFPVAIPCMLCSAAGGFLGSRMAIKTGRKLIRLVLAFVAVLLFAKILFDLVKSG
ncbi:MAG TPA: hypothetical protein DEQ14_09780 [Treponema sp.]|nr:hypothetical protein [Treponema sp.]